MGWIFLDHVKLESQKHHQGDRYHPLPFSPSSEFTLSNSAKIPPPTPALPSSLPRKQDGLVNRYGMLDMCPYFVYHFSCVHITFINTQLKFVFLESYHWVLAERSRSCSLQCSQHFSLDSLRRFNTSVSASLPLQKNASMQKKFLKTGSLITLKFMETYLLMIW